MFLLAFQQEVLFREAETLRRWSLEGVSESLTKLFCYRVCYTSSLNSPLHALLCSEKMVGIRHMLVPLGSFLLLGIPLHDIP